MINSASWAALVDSADWVSAGVFVVLVLALGSAAWNGLQAPDALYDRYRDNRARTKSAIDVNHVLPDLARLVAAVNEQVARSIAEDLSEPVSALPLEVATDVELLQNRLQSADYRRALDRVSVWSSDFKSLDALYDGAIVWARSRGGCSAAAAILLTVAGVHVVFKAHPIPSSIVGAAEAAAVIWAVIGLGCFGAELTARNRLGRLFRRYE